MSRLTPPVKDDNVAEEYIRFIAENVAPRAVSIQEIEEVSAEDKEITRLWKYVHTNNW